jgi:hypothetical protein
MNRFFSSLRHESIKSGIFFWIFKRSELVNDFIEFSESLFYLEVLRKFKRMMNDGSRSSVYYSFVWKATTHRETPQYHSVKPQPWESPHVYSNNFHVSSFTSIAFRNRLPLNEIQIMTKVPFTCPQHSRSDRFVAGDFQIIGQTNFYAQIDEHFVKVCHAGTVLWRSVVPRKCL